MDRKQFRLKSARARFHEGTRFGSADESPRATSLPLRPRAPFFVRKPGSRHPIPSPRLRKSSYERVAGGGKTDEESKSVPPPFQPLTMAPSPPLSPSYGFRKYPRCAQTRQGVAGFVGWMRKRKGGIRGAKVFERRSPEGKGDLRGGWRAKSALRRAARRSRRAKWPA